MVRTKRKEQPIIPIDIQPHCKKTRIEKISSLQRKKRKQNNDSNEEIRCSKKICSQINTNQGMVSYTPEYIQHLKESYDKRSYLGEPNYQCKYCRAIFWYNERNQTESRYGKQVIYTDNGFTLYRRRNNNMYIRRENHNLDNRWVVPYNINLLKKYQAHINVEYVNKSKLLKYLCKYVNKGHGQASIMFQRIRPRDNQASSEQVKHID